MFNENYVWYASYGSNLLRERFLCYIQGGQPIGSKRNYIGCKDKSEPVSEAAIILNYDLYFAKTSSNWQDGGVGFIKTQLNSNIITYGYMYLITKEQFCDVVKQEIQSKNRITIDFETAIIKGNLIFLPGSWYGNLIFIDYKNDYPIFTFTHEIDIKLTVAPSKEYLTMIISGLIKTHKLSVQEIRRYLLSKEGVNENYIEEQLIKMTSDLI